MNTPRIGDRGSFRVGSDVYPATVQAVSKSGKTVEVREIKFVAGEGHDYFGVQVWDFIDTGKGPVEKFRWSNKYNCYRNGSCSLSLTGWRAYQDPHF